MLHVSTNHEPPRPAVLLAGFASACLMLVCGCTGLVSTHKVKWVENEPLLNPLPVESVQKGSILLADGRRVQIPSGTELPCLDEQVTSVELAETSTKGEYDVYLKERSVIRCGNPYNGLLKLPLVTDEIPKYTRVYVGKGKLEKSAR